jgi:hypothetical protein
MQALQGFAPVAEALSEIEKVPIVKKSDDAFITLRDLQFSGKSEPLQKLVEKQSIGLSAWKSLCEVKKAQSDLINPDAQILLNVGRKLLDVSTQVVMSEKAKGVFMNSILYLFFGVC